MTDVDVDKLPPTQGLLLEVLAARFRLGEPFWNFPNVCTRAARSLEASGLIWLRSGPVEECFQAGLTDAGRTAVLSDTYQPPNGARPPVEYQWGVRTIHADGSQGIDWSSEDDARSFLIHYADYDGSPAMRVLRRELVRRAITAGDVEPVDSDYGQRRNAADRRRGWKPSTT